MPGSKESMKIQELQTHFETHWPGYTVVGNRPYAKGCYLFRKAETSGAGILVLATKKNWEMAQIVTHPNFNPDDFVKDKGKGFFCPEEVAGTPSLALFVLGALDECERGGEIIKALTGIDVINWGNLSRVKALRRKEGK